MTSWEGTKTFFYASYSLSKSTKDVFNLLGAETLWTLRLWYTIRLSVY